MGRWDLEHPHGGYPNRPPGLNNVDPVPQMTDDLRRLRMRLVPLLSVEEILVRRICPNFECYVQRPRTGDPYSQDVSLRRSRDSFRGPADRTLSPEVVVHAAHCLRTFSERWSMEKERPSTTAEKELREVRTVIEACATDMKALWENDTVQAILKNRKIHMQDQSGL